MSTENFWAQDNKDTWQTPQWLLDLLLEHVDIDVDPCAGPNTEYGRFNYRGPCGWVNGLVANWFGTVFINPPFSQKGEWIDAVIERYENGEIDRAIILTPDSTDVKSWWHDRLADYCEFTWFSKGRIKYIDPETGETAGNPTFGTALNFLGNFPYEMYEDLADHGDLVLRW